jgi:hypothetical protein
VVYGHVSSSAMYSYCLPTRLGRRLSVRLGRSFSSLPPSTPGPSRTYSANSPPRSILIVNKLRTQPVVLAIDALLEYSPRLLLLSEPHSHFVPATSIPPTPTSESSTRIALTSLTAQRSGIPVGLPARTPLYPSHLRPSQSRQHRLGRHPRRRRHHSACFVKFTPLFT